MGHKKTQLNIFLEIGAQSPAICWLLPVVFSIYDRMLESSSYEL